jgi:hypothetical protein
MGVGLSSMVLRLLDVDVMAEAVKPLGDEPGGGVASAAVTVCEIFWMVIPFAVRVEMRVPDSRLPRNFNSLVWEVVVALSGRDRGMFGDPGRRSRTRLPRAGMCSPFRGQNCDLRTESRSRFLFQHISRGNKKAQRIALNQSFSFQANDVSEMLMYPVPLRDARLVESGRAKRPLSILISRGKCVERGTLSPERGPDTSPRQAGPRAPPRVIDH